MAEGKGGRADPPVRGGVRRDFFLACLLVGRPVGVGGAANVDRHGFPVCRSAQLVRAALFPDASAGKVWPLTEFLCCGVRGYFLSYSGLCFSPCALLHKSLVGRELADGDRHVEYLHVAVGGRVDYFAKPAELPARLVLGDADCLYVMRFELARARVVQSCSRVRASAGRALVSRSAFAPN